MNKLSGLYKLFSQERNMEMSDEISGGLNREKINQFLKTKLNANDYFIADELITELEISVEEKGFKAGCRFTTELNDEMRNK